MNEIIKLENVEKIYELGKSKIYALKNINLKINEAETVAIVGPSGSGKSTLLHIIGCLDKPTKGKVFIDGLDVSKLNENELAKIRREKIGFVFQFFYLISHMNALENVMLPMIFKNVPKKEREERAYKLLKIVGLEKKAFHKPDELSGGERQRVAIARALANNPKILLADEPTGSLDSKSGTEIIKLFLKLNKMQKITLVVVTHNFDVAKRMKRIIYLKDGMIIKEEK